jgi:hypothetical protein
MGPVITLLFKLIGPIQGASDFVDEGLDDEELASKLLSGNI